jgi:hypothetical protein
VIHCDPFHSQVWLVGEAGPWPHPRRCGAVHQRARTAPLPSQVQSRPAVAGAAGWRQARQGMGDRSRPRGRTSARTNSSGRSRIGRSLRAPRQCTDLRGSRGSGGTDLRRRSPEAARTQRPVRRHQPPRRQGDFPAPPLRPVVYARLISPMGQHDSPVPRTGRASRPGRIL